MSLNWDAGFNSTPRRLSLGLIRGPGLWRLGW